MRAMILFDVIKEPYGMDTILSTEDLCRDFKIGDGSVVNALKNINIEIEKGKLTILRGRSGSGKTTLINILGASACFNQIAMTVVQIVMNNTLSHYGAQSIYGGDIPLACAGIITKVNMIFMSFVIGISQGTQPVIGFNYGAKKYARVRKTYLLALGAASALSLIAFACFQIFPRQIISIFGNGSDLYFKFSERYFRIYMFLTIVNGIQPVTSNFFNSIGKSQLGVFMSLTRQIIFLLPLIIIFPIFMGIDGVMYAGPIADAAAAIVCGYFTIRELKELKKLEIDLTKC